MVQGVGWFNPAVAGRALILRSLLRYNDVHFIPRQLAARWLIVIAPVFRFDYARNMLNPNYRKALIIGCHSE